MYEREGFALTPPIGSPPVHHPTFSGGPPDGRLADPVFLSCSPRPPVVAGLSACSGGDDGYGRCPGRARRTRRRPPRQVGTILTANSTAQLGTVVIDGQGYTLYRFDKDSAKPPTSNCAGECAQKWPPVLATPGTPLTVEGVDAGGGGHDQPRRRNHAADAGRLAGLPLQRRPAAGRDRVARAWTAAVGGGDPEGKKAGPLD